MFLLKLLWLRRDWLWSPIDPLREESFWRALPTDGSSIAAIDSHLWLRPRGRAIPSGWYLFLIQHRGNNPCVTGRLRSGRFGMTQGRPLFPVRPRFRVVHVNRARPLTLELQNVPEPLKLQRLWLLRLPAWEARRRIRKRLNRLDWRMPERYKERWRYYNQLLCSQAGILPWITHSQYQQKDQGDNEPGRFLVKGPSRVWVGLGIPLMLALLFFYGVGRDRYQVRSDVVVRKAGQDSAADGLSIGNLLGGGNQGSLEDSRYLRTYLESPQVLEDLEKQFNFRQAYAQQGLDPFAGLWFSPSREDVYRFFRKQVVIQLDEGSGVMRITSLAFDADTAIRLNSFLNQQAEVFVNRLNQDVYRRQLAFAKKQVAENLKKVKIASKALQSFQQDRKFLSAQTEAQLGGGLIAALEAELAKQKVKLAALRRQFVDPKAPEIRHAEVQVSELQRQVAVEREALVSPVGRNLPAQAAKLAELEADLKFQSELYQASLAAAETTRIDSLKQQRFLAVLSKPLKPDEPWQYWRHKGFFTTFAILLVGFALTKFLLGMADSHRN